MKGITKYNSKIISEVLGGKSYALSALDHLADSPVCVDLGANIGAFSLACKVWRPDARLISVEPDPACFGFLQSNLSDFADADLRNIAISDTTGSVRLNVGRNDSVMNSIFAGAMADDARSVEVRSFGAREFLDDVLSTYGRIDLLKADIEGAEWHLANLPGGILASIPLIFMEYHSARFVAEFLPSMLTSHCLISGSIRFPHRGELALLRQDLIPADQAAFEIMPDLGSAARRDRPDRPRITRK
ncbi:FkbM family methyltransferase [Fodinicurvata sp. EGI_FJ10296]|uniref:FkbM family methyltransferase n=1 Tax=Fodinicurvata sp. EGI_FJ10296 TaxID=3231908 RepID=UPI00345143B3